MTRSLLGLALFAVSTLALAQVPDKPFIAVQGHAEERLVPDVFPVEITITDTSQSAGESQALVEGLARQVVAAAEKLKVPDKDLTIGNLRISPEQRWDDKLERNIFTGNRYERHFTVRLRTLSDLRSLVALLPEGRNLRLQTQGFERSDAGVIRRRLRSQAVADAQEQARDLASATGVRLGRLYTASDRPMGLPYARNVSAIEAVSVSGNVLTSEMIVKEGEISIQSDVYLVYLIEG